MVRIMSSRMVATTTTEMSSTAIPTVSRTIGSPNPYNYWWLRSPYTGNISGAYLVSPDGGVYVGFDYVDNSYGRIYLDRLFQIPFKILVVKIAVHEHSRPPRCVERGIGW